MIYLDYSATTPLNRKVLDVYEAVSIRYFANPNSHHQLGRQAKALIDQATNEIAGILKIKPEEIIYTSGASEANNTALISLAERQNRYGRQIITTELEHSSIYGPLSNLTDHGYQVDFVGLDENGLVDLAELESRLSSETIMVIVSLINSETGIKQDIKAIRQLLLNYPNCLLHVDITQAVGKIPVDLSLIDTAALSAHKFYGPKGIGLLYKKERLTFRPLIAGGKSTTVYRSGTPATPLIIAMKEALEIADRNLAENYRYVQELNTYLRTELQFLPDVRINSNAFSIPHILNISVLGVIPDDFIYELEKQEVYISSQSACALGDVSKAVLALTHDHERAVSSLRISLSACTTAAEIKQFLLIFRQVYDKIKDLPTKVSM
ncbi:MAG: cysteine desulfurase family protein [Erysipelotrichaceae bacterium]|nr:cysteine desulfurase family protein [Erysipelotrichaceae bacterium]